MKVWTVAIILGALAMATGGYFVISHLHRTVGLGGIGIGAVLIIVGLGGRLAARGAAPTPKGKVVTPLARRGGYRKALIAVIVVILIAVGTFYGTSYLEGVQPGASQSSFSSNSSGQTSLQSSLTQGPTNTTTTGSGTVTTLSQSTNSLSTTTETSTPITTTSTSSSGTSTTLTSNSGTSTTQTSTGTNTVSSVSSSTSTQTQSSSATTIPSSSCSSTPKSLDGSAIEYSASGKSGVVDLSTSRSGDVVVLFTSALTNPEGNKTDPPTVSAIADGIGSLSFRYRDSFVTFEPDAGGNLFSEEEWYAVTTTPLVNDPINVTLTGSTDSLTIIALAVSGVSNTSSPFDPNVQAPVGVSGTTVGTIAAGISTTCSDDIVIGAVVLVNPTLGPGQGYNLIQSDNGLAPRQDIVAEDASVSTPQNGLQVTFECEPQPFTQVWVIMADALN